MSVDVKDFSKLRRKAQIGDILVMSPNNAPGGGGLIDKAFNAISNRIQGDLTHSAIYAGKGEVLDFNLSNGIRRMSLVDAVKGKDGKGLDVALVRPNTSQEDREWAVKKIDKARNNQRVHYSVPQLFKTLASRAAPILGSDSKRLSAEVCSTLIAKAFNKKIVDTMHRNAVVPSDFLSSKHTKHLLTLRQVERPEKTAQEYERMTSAKWKQTAKDLPATVLSTGVGYGIGRTLAELIGRDFPNKPNWVKALPVATTAIGLASNYAGKRTREILDERRQGAV